MDRLMGWTPNDRLSYDGDIDLRRARSRIREYVDAFHKAPVYELRYVAVTQLRELTDAIQTLNWTSLRGHEPCVEGMTALMRQLWALSSIGDWENNDIVDLGMMSAVALHFGQTAGCDSAWDAAAMPVWRLGERLASDWIPIINGRTAGCGLNLRQGKIAAAIGSDVLLVRSARDRMHYYGKDKFESLRVSFLEVI